MVVRGENWEKLIENFRFLKNADYRNWKKLRTKTISKQGKY